MDPSSQVVSLSDGRLLGYAFYGSSSPNAYNIFYFHGIPSSRLEAAILAPYASSLNVRIVAIDRPGMGLSNFQDKRQVMDWPLDVVALADHLQLPTFSILAYSGGAAYALACARIISSSRLLSVGIMGGVYPLDFKGRYNPMRFFLKPLEKAITSGISSHVGSSLNNRFGELARSSNPAAFYEANDKEMQHRPKIEQDALREAKIQVLYEPLREALRVDGKGIGRDSELAGSDWGFKLEEIPCGNSGVRIKVWHGSADVNMPMNLVSDAQKKIDGAELKILRDVGHIGVLVYHGGEILKDIAVNARGAY
ncbi:hypothetical protein BP6252_06516 [Coleophoma cylindrospora]|uniref:AB hydrolase-1 domain-containing protein n=1 Tax=Coleophoma cylindrospora TaxID=1849047 RepID=A0A3D8RNA6_9HELO|nr:hypothetical protein BP6252_06516 [Coleophoma cylindrospora]